MNNAFKTENDTETLAAEVTCLKALVTYLLKAVGQADAGRIIVNMERQISEIDDEHLSGTFKNTIAQIKTEYRKYFPAWQLMLSGDNATNR